MFHRPVALPDLIGATLALSIDLRHPPIEEPAGVRSDQVGMLLGQAPVRGVDLPLR